MQRRRFEKAAKGREEDTPLDDVLRRLVKSRTNQKKDGDQSKPDRRPDKSR